MQARPGPRCTCRSAARRTRATATARRGRRRSTSSPSGSRSTSTTRAACSGRRSTTWPSRRLRRLQDVALAGSGDGSADVEQDEPDEPDQDEHGRDDENNAEDVARPADRSSVLVIRDADRAHEQSLLQTVWKGQGVKARLSTDGGARGNPGPAAYGYVLEAEDGTVLAAHGETIGVATNNVAEYRGLIAGLEVVSDSELLVKQMKGEYRVKNENLRPLNVQASRLARQVGRVRWTSVRRERNELADRLVNEALDGAT